MAEITLILVYLLGAAYVADQFEEHSRLSERWSTAAGILWPIMVPITLIASLIMGDR